MEIFKQIIDLVKGIAWPSFALIVVFIFRGQVKTFLESIIEIGPQGIKRQPLPEQIAPPAPAKEVSIVQEGKMFHLPEAHQAIAEVENNVERSFNNNYTGEFSAEEFKKIFIREYAILSLNSFCQQIWLQIMGTQIEALELLALVPSLPEATLSIYYGHHLEKTKNADFPQMALPDGGTWLRFLTSSNLIRLNDDSTLSITYIGKYFLDVFIPMFKLNKNNKPF